MLRPTLDSTLRAASHRGVWLPSLAGTLAQAGALRLFGWPATSFAAGLIRSSRTGLSPGRPAAPLL